MATSTAATPPATRNNVGTKQRVTTSIGVEHACTGLARFADMASGAGKDLNVSSSTKVGDNPKIPPLLGADCVISIGSNPSHAIGPVHLVHHDHPSKSLMFSATPVAR
jgi:hypothetical protein